MALEGKTGQVLWRLLTNHELFAINCDNDITEDGINDCIVGGRMAVLLLFKVFVWYQIMCLSN